MATTDAARSPAAEVERRRAQTQAARDTRARRSLPTRIDYLATNRHLLSDEQRDQLRAVADGQAQT